MWKLENELYPLVDLCAQALSDTPLFFLINGYTTGFSASVLGNIARRCLVARYGGKVEADELCLTVTTGGVLPWRHDRAVAARCLRSSTRTIT